MWSYREWRSKLRHRGERSHAESNTKDGCHGVSTPMMQKESRLLALDDEESLTPLIREIGEGAGFEVVVTEASAPFKVALGLHAPTVIMLDLHMLDMDGVEVLRFLASEKSQAAIVLVSGLDARTISSAAQYGRRHGLNVVGTLQKPFMPEDLLRLLRSAKAAAQPPTQAHVHNAHHSRTPAAIEIGGQCS